MAPEFSMLFRLTNKLLILVGRAAAAKDFDLSTGWSAAEEFPLEWASAGAEIREEFGGKRAYALTRNLAQELGENLQWKVA